MAHLVLGYPTLAESIRTAEAYARAGMQILELQIPFSHPTADGPVITAACQEAVRQGVSVQDCIAAIRTIRERWPEQEIMVMSYVNRVFAFGFQRFASEMKEVGVQHLIVPDLPVDSAAAASFIVHRSSFQLVPVLAANVSDARLDQLLGMGFDFFYLMSDFKITGSGFSLNPRLREVIGKIKSAGPTPPPPPNGRGGTAYTATNASEVVSSPLPFGGGVGGGVATRYRVGIGFGISTPEQARLVADEADVAIIGSALIQAQREGRLEGYLGALQAGFDQPMTTFKN